MKGEIQNEPCYACSCKIYPISLFDKKWPEIPGGKLDRIWRRLQGSAAIRLVDRLHLDLLIFLAAIDPSSASKRSGEILLNLEVVEAGI